MPGPDIGLDTFNNLIVVIRGAGDIATGVAHRLYRAGFHVVLTELREPLAVRCRAAFSKAILDGKTTVEGVGAVRVASIEQAMDTLRIGSCGTPPDEAESAPIPVIIDPDGTTIPKLRPVILIDARMAKRNVGTTIHDARLVIGLGPGFTAGVDVHAVIETARGHYLGQAIYHGRAQEFTGVPGEVGGFTAERVLRAPSQGELRAMAELGARVEAGQTVAEVAAGAERVPIKAAIPGVLRGMLRDGAPVSKGQKVGDVDPRCDPEAVWHISDKARAVAGGVLEAIMCLLWGRPPAGPAQDTGASEEMGRQAK